MRNAPHSFPHYEDCEGSLYSPASSIAGTVSYGKASDDPQTQRQESKSDNRF